MSDQNHLAIAGHRHSHSHEHEDSEEETVEAFQPAFVFDAHYLGEEVPPGFDAVRIPLDGTLKADLSWENERQAAFAYVQKGMRIFWEIDLGLFDRLKYPLENQTQFLSLCLSLEHFRDTLWTTFRAQTVGICLYRGPLQLYKWRDSQQTNLQGWLQDLYGSAAKFAEETGLDVADFASIDVQMLSSCDAGQRLLALFCRDAAGEYLDLLAHRLPDNIRCFALMDGAGVADRVLMAQLLTKERFPRLYLGVKNVLGLGGEFAWEGEPLPAGLLARQLEKGKAQTTRATSLGVCLPGMTQCRQRDTQGLEEVLNVLTKKNLPFRLIPESLLTTEWDGLDYLFVISQSISFQGRRKLQGFCAAGGTVVVVGEPLGLAEEIDFRSWLRT